MKAIKDLLQNADWKDEKHVPYIDCPDTIKKGECVSAVVTVGKEIVHPNTTEHHIRFIEVYFQPEGEKFPYHIGSFNFNAHGESVDGPNESSIYTVPTATIHFKTEKPGTLYVMSYCNIHGLWEGSHYITMN